MRRSKKEELLSLCFYLILIFLIAVFFPPIMIGGFPLALFIIYRLIERMTKED